MSSDEEVVEEYGVDVLKAIRIMFDEKTQGPVPRYLTSWVGYTDFFDEWSPPDAFATSELIDSFEREIPPTFDRTKIGNVWTAPEDWIENERKAYYEENPAEHPKWEIAKRRNREELKQAEKERKQRLAQAIPQYRKQEIENEKTYRQYLAKSKASFHHPKPQKKSNVPKKDRFVATIRYRKVPTGDALKGIATPRSKAGTRKSSPAVRLSTKDARQANSSHPLSINTFEETHKYDGLFTDSESDDDDTPLAAQVKPSTLQPENNSSDSDVPLWKLNKDNQSVKPHSITGSDIVSKPLPPTVPLISAPAIVSPINPRLKGYNPISAKANAWDQVHNLVPLGRNRPLQQSSLPPARVSSEKSFAPPISHTSVPLPPAAIPSSVTNPPDPVFEDVVQHDSPMEVDSFPDAIEFMQSAIETTPVTPTEKVSWEPITIALNNGKGLEKLCQGLLQKVTAAPNPPTLKWIHREGFNIQSIRALPQLEILLYRFEPWQHAQLGGQTQQDTEILAAFATYLSQMSAFALADTANPKVKLCFQASDSSFAADCMNIPARSELRLGPLHLIVTVMKGKFESDTLPKPPTVSGDVDYDWCKAPPTLRHSSVPPRAFATLRFPVQVKEILQSRGPSLKTYYIFTAEGLPFRYEVPSDIPQPDQANKVRHREETRALESIMRSLEFKPRPATVGTATVIFIHNAAWEMLKYLPGFHDRKTHIKKWFFCYGQHHTLHPRLWGVREVFKRGGVVTFTTKALLENPSNLGKVLECIQASSNVWLAYITPAVVGMLQDKAIHNPEDENVITALLTILNAVKKGTLSMLSAPPHPWKVDEWSKWLEVQLELDLFGGSLDPDEAILNAAEKALDMVASPPAPQRPNCSCTYPVDTGLFDVKMTRPRLIGRVLEEAVDKSVFQDLRQIMSIPVLHTEYRHFVVTRDPEAGQRKGEGLVPRELDSIAHLSFSMLAEVDKATFGSLRSSSSFSVSTPASAVPKQPSISPSVPV